MAITADFTTIKFDDLLTDNEKKEAGKPGKELFPVVQMLEAALHAYYNKKDKKPDAPAIRRVARTLDKIAESSGPIELHDWQWAMLVESWTTAEIEIPGGVLRTLWHRIDQLLCPDEYAKNEE